MQSADEAFTLVPSGRTTVVEDVGGGQVRSGAGRPSGTGKGCSDWALPAADAAATDPRQATMNATILMVWAYPTGVDIW
jgi:hypothetical protein